MIDLQIESTKTSPYIMVDSTEKIIELKGKSTPENAVQFYYPVINNIKKLFSAVSGEIHVNMALEYFNTSSSKCIFDMLKVLKSLQDDDREIVINWYYEEDDEDMLETGEDYQDLLGMNFNYIELEY
ncbi:MAG: nuclear pore complex subunit [Flammeovirgaceae bacterium]|nr:nuclear pore complex subunit [Flammeovirgaceae bacterium]MBR07051.1 nuclear pore complex subunit [Rickettsiales bacterium]